MIMTTTKVSPEELSRLLPPQDRRRRKRILTLRHAGIGALVVVVCFLIVSAWSEFRREKPGQHGRLYSRRTRVVEFQSRRPYTVVKETQISDSRGADPLLIDAARRAQWLGVTDADIARMREALAPTTPYGTGATSIPGGEGILQQNSTREKARIEITGGPEGVQIKKDER